MLAIQVSTGEGVGACGYVYTSGFYSSDYDESQESYCWGSNYYLTLQATFNSPTLSASNSSAYGYNWGATAVPSSGGTNNNGAFVGVKTDGTWVSNTTYMTGSPQANTCGNFAYQFVDLKPVILPEGVFATGVSFTSWFCSGASGETYAWATPTKKGLGGCELKSYLPPCISNPSHPHPHPQQ